MQKQVQGVFQVSDGIIVQFSNGASGYFPTSFLLEQLSAGSNQLFVDTDPSPHDETSPEIAVYTSGSRDEWLNIPN